MQPVHLTRSLAQRLELGDDARGVLVVMVESDSPADRGGLLVGDVIVAVGHQAIGEPQDVAELLSGEQAGQSLALSVVRGGERRSIDVTLGERAPAGDVRRRGRG